MLFDDSHFCVLRTVFHAVLMGNESISSKDLTFLNVDFKFRTSPIEALRETTFTENGEEERKSIPVIPPPKTFPEFLARNTANCMKLYR